MITVGVTGASSSGKVTFCQLLADVLSNSVLVIHQSDYYYDIEKLTASEHLQYNFDHPDAYDSALLSTHLDQLKAYQSVTFMAYNPHTGKRDQERTLVPADVVICEGLLLLDNYNLRKRFDYKVFIESDLDICLLRRIKRDVKEYKMDLELVLERYILQVRPAFFEFVEPCKKWVDVVFSWKQIDPAIIDQAVEQINALVADLP